MNRILIAMLAASVALLTGCGQKAGPARFAVAPGQYQAAFDATRRVLADHRFLLERVDARAGVITTQPKGTVGLASPWDREQSSLGQEFEDLTNQHERVVRVEFAAGGEPAGLAPSAGVADLRIAGGPLEARVSVEVLRVHRPGLRIETESIRRSSYQRDLVLAERGAGGVFRSAVGNDERLAGRLAERIQLALGTRPTPRQTGAIEISDSTGVASTTQPTGENEQAGDVFTVPDAREHWRQSCPAPPPKSP